MATIYDQNVKLQAIADAITNQSITITTGQDLLDSLADIANAMQPAAANISYDNTNSGLQAVNVQQAVDENADSISTLNSSIDAINNTHIRGLKWKTFSYTYNAATVAGNVYSVSNAKQTVFGLTASDTIVGISITSAGGNNNSIFTIPLYSAYNDMFVFKPDASNTSLTGFSGVVFYQ